MAISRAVNPSTYRQPASGAPVRSHEAERPHVVFRDIAMPVAFAIVVALALILYIAGYALVTSANYDRIHLKARMASVRSENEVIQGEIDGQSSHESVAAWTRTNNMVDGVAPVVIVGNP
jgi:hypothetical protein